MSNSSDNIDRRWRYRLVDFGTAHDETHRGIALVEVWEVADRPVVFRGDAIELRDGCATGEVLETAATRLRRRIEECAAAMSRPVLSLSDMRVEVPTDWPTLDEQCGNFA